MSQRGFRWNLLKAVCCWFALFWIDIHKNVKTHHLTWKCILSLILRTWNNNDIVEKQCKKCTKLRKVMLCELSIFPVSFSTSQDIEINVELYVWGQRRFIWKGILDGPARIASLAFKESGDTWFYHFARISACINPQEWSHRFWYVCVCVWRESMHAWKHTRAFLRVLSMLLCALHLRALLSHPFRTGSKKAHFKNHMNLCDRVLSFSQLTELFILFDFCS